MAKVALLAFHGQGSQDPGYSDELKEELSRRLDAAFGEVTFREIYYQGILKDHQTRYWGEVEDGLGWHKLRELVWHGFGDPATLESSAEERDGAYALVQVEIAKTLLAVRGDLGGTDRPIVALAQSLGGQVISNYLWDGQKAAAGKTVWVGIWANIQHYAPSIKPGGLSTAELAYLKQPGVARLFTTGCNIPVFISGTLNPQPIARPTEHFEWHNYYDRDDVLGWPLQPLSQAYSQLVNDHLVGVGGLFTGWNPFSHGEYWEDDAVLDPLEQALRVLLQG